MTPKKPFNSSQMTKLDVSDECSILALVLLDRLVERTRTVVCTQNVFPLITSAYIVACKLHEDAYGGILMTINHYLPFLSISLLGEMERLFLKSIDYRLHVGYDQFRFYVDIVNDIE
eukprot:TRINITY_DN4511_c0_g1_i2.p1 TRINITY_DN4511_c0_g1~~TRINITY_DN4511_c0_g1_i2.p1  ORF type:complete len:117 (-),score=17.01 TRINITY_DN4511_c0_g1_i2:82-432(-)